MARPEDWTLKTSASELEQAWKDRIKDAQSLLSAGRTAASILAGMHALEILLKLKLCRLLKIDKMPVIFQIPDLNGLATVAGIRGFLDDDTFKQTSVGQNWARVVRYSSGLNALRYNSSSNWSAIQAQEFMGCLLDESDGIIPWIQRSS